MKKAREWYNYIVNESYHVVPDYKAMSKDDVRMSIAYAFNAMVKETKEWLDHNKLRKLFDREFKKELNYAIGKERFY